jgi:serine/threonine protein kinase
LRLPGLPFDIHVIGLDSAWLAGDHADAGKLRLTDGQVGRLCTDSEDGRPWDGFRLALVHHPLTDLADGSECRRLLSTRWILLLRGHLHDAEAELWADPDRTLRAVAAGCLYEGDAADRYPNSCVLVRITCDDAGRPQSYDLRLRSFSTKGGHWHDDTDLYPGAPQGRVKIRLDATSTKQPQTVRAANALASPHVVSFAAPIPRTSVPALIAQLPSAEVHPVLQRLPGLQPDDESQKPIASTVRPEVQQTVAPLVHPLHPNSQIGDYRILRLLGQGGMGSVYEAVKLSIDRRVALKFLHADTARHQDAIKRFLNEARASSRIEHPSIIEVSDASQASDGTPYLVMEFLPGESLAARLRQVHGAKQRLPLLKALQVAWQTADALVAAHAKGIIHRDLKPDNLMLVADPVAPGKERVKLLDFGIAKLTQEITAAQPMTANNQLLGTPMYMSPEQCRSAASVDDKSDVYALGVVLYEMLAGRPPFLADQMAQFITQHLFEAPPPLAAAAHEVPPEISRLVHRMLAKDKDARPAMREAALLLEKLQEGSRVGETVPSRLNFLLSYKAHAVIGAVIISIVASSIYFHTIILSSVGFYAKTAKNEGPVNTISSSVDHPPPPPPLPVEPMRLAMTIKPERVLVGQNVQVRVASNERVYLLLLSVEETGKSTVLAPWGSPPTLVTAQTPLSFPPRGNRFAAMLPRGVSQATESLWAIGVKDRAIYDELCRLARKSLRDETILRWLMVLPKSAYTQERKSYQIVRNSQ